MKEIISRRIGTDITLGPMLGRGNTYKVRIGYKNGIEYAVKYLKLKNYYDHKGICKQIINEVQTLKDLSHPYIIRVHDYSCSEYYIKEYIDHVEEIEVCYYLLDKVKGPNLRSIVNNSGRLTEHFARFYFKQILEVVKYIHESNYAHRNLRLETILLDKDYNIILTGFKHAKKTTLFSGEFEEEQKQSIPTCPESLRSNTINPIMEDVFLLGNILFSILHRNPPYKWPSTNDLHYKHIFGHNIATFWKLFSKVIITQQAKDLIVSMLAFEPIFRPSLCEIEYNEWMQGEVPTHEELRKKIIELTDFIEIKEKKDAKRRKELRLKTVGVSGCFYGHGSTRSGVNGGTGYLQKKSYKILYKADNIPNTRIYTCENPIDIENTLKSYLEELAMDYKIDEKKYKIEAKFTESNLLVQIKIKIRKIDEEINCISVEKAHGDYDHFYQIFDELKNYIIDVL